MKFIIILLLLLVLIIFTIQNYEIVKIRFLIWSFQTSRAIMIFLSVLIGGVIGLIVSRSRKRN
ncbi:MAG: LapA family protein [Spirochaetes bacterium]|nr:LapA family protein [Spirochaetota bacterium]